MPMRRERFQIGPLGIRSLKVGFFDKSIFDRTGLAIPQVLSSSRLSFSWLRRPGTQTTSGSKIRKFFYGIH